MADFFERPILNSPYEQPGEHWELDANRQPTNKRIASRRPAAFITPVPKPRRQRLALQWLREHLVCKGGTHPAQLLYKQLGDDACERITRAIVRENIGSRPATVVLDPYNSSGSTADVHFATAKETYSTDPRRCHVNHVVCDSGWEAEFARTVEAHPKVWAYVKNQGLGFTVPYRLGGEARTYLPDFIVLADDGRGANDPLHLVVEVKGRRREDAKTKKETMETQWVPGVNRLGEYGRWGFLELREVYNMRDELDAALAALAALEDRRRDGGR